MSKIVKMSWSEFIESMSKKKLEAEREDLLRQIRYCIAKTDQIYRRANVLTVTHGSGLAVVVKNKYGRLNFNDVPEGIKYEMFETYEQWKNDHNAKYVNISYKMLNRYGQELLDEYMKRFERVRKQVIL
jgi:hypothetical protein